MGTTIGTAYFASKRDAIKYYQQYVPVGGWIRADTNIRQWVESKLADGEIHIGVPPHDVAEHVWLDEDNRYHITRG